MGVVDDGHAIVSGSACLPWPAARRRRWGYGRRRGGWLAQAGLSIGDCRSMGIGSPGTCNSADGRGGAAYNLGWDHVPVCRMLEQLFAFPAASATTPTVPLWPSRWPVRRWAYNVVLITLGTGVGGGIIIGGKNL